MKVIINVALAVCCGFAAITGRAGEYDNTIHPGKADGSGFWNVRSIWFMYAPAFAFKQVPGAAAYRFTVKDAFGGERVFTAEEPTASLEPVWGGLPVCDATVVCEGVDAAGKALGKAGERSFLKVAGFREGKYPKPARSFVEAARGIYDYAFKMKALQHLLDTGKLDMGDPINSYASKACAGFINAMTDYAKLVPTDRERALAIARKAAEYLIDGAEKEGAPLAWFPQTYAGKGEGNTGIANKGLIMLSYPAVAGSAMLRLYEATGEARWLDYAEKIGGTYLKLQGEDGTWYLKMRAADGQPVNPNRLVPVQNALPFFEKLFALTGKAEYRSAADKAFAYVDRTRLADWNWEGQFEDVPPTKMYTNLTKHDAVSTAILLLERFPGDRARLAQARELMRFTEDQFVCWEPPAAGGAVRHYSKWHPTERYDEWVTPCALEQYNCYWPIDASAAKVIRGYLALYEATRDPVDLAKARTLGASITRVQKENGRVPTWWWKKKGGQDWMNCMFASAQALMQLAVIERPAEEPARRVVFHVDARATAGGDGSEMRPWRTVAEAVAGVRAARVGGTVQAGEGVDIVFRAGDYFIADGIELSEADSGSTEAPVRWLGAKDGRTRFLGGVRIPATAFRKVTDAATLARLPEEARGKVYAADLSALVPGKIPEMAKVFGGTPSAPLLFTGGKFGTLARWPNTDYTSFTQRVDKGGVEVTRPDGTKHRRPGAFVYADPRAKRWNFAEGVWMNGYWTHDWDNQSVQAATYGVENGTNDVIRLAANIPYGVMGGTWGRKDRRFFVFNLLDELDAPGEWWIDRTRKILYLRPPNDEPRETDETTLVFSAKPLLKAVRAKGLRFRRIEFAYGYGDGVVAIGKDIRFANCRVTAFGGTGLVLAGDRNMARNVEACELGRGGMSVSGGDRRTLRKSGTLVENCHVHDWAIFQRTYASGIGVDGCGVTLRRNVMHDAPHTAVLYGGNEHLFEYNEVYRVLMETGDAGAYYTGRDWTTQGNVLRYNNTHDLGAEGEHANTMGFYFDDCDCGDEVYGNIFHNVARGIMVGGGREHPIRNNIFSKCLVGLSIDCRGMTWKHWNSEINGGDSWLLEKKAQAFDYTNGVWAAAYPRLAKIMRDHPREPLYDPVENNIFIDCRNELLALDGKATECLSRMAPIAGNLVINTIGTNGVRTAKPDRRIAAGFRIVNGRPLTPFDAGFVDAANGNFALKPDAWLRKELPAFEPLPQCR